MLDIGDDDLDDSLLFKGKGLLRKFTCHFVLFVNFSVYEHIFFLVKIYCL